MNVLLRCVSVAVVAAVTFSQTAHATVYTLRALLDGAQVVAGGGSTSTATGIAVVTLDSALFTVTTDLTWTGLSGPADRAHLHSGLAGHISDEVFFHDVLYVAWPGDPQGPTVTCAWGTFGICVPESGSSHDVLQLSANDGYGYPNFASMVDAFMNREIYIDVHTQLYPAGEIRGQLAPVPEPSTWATMLLGFAGLGLAGYYRARKSPAAVAVV